MAATWNGARETFSTSRALEYFELRSLEPMTGHCRYEFPTALLKELIDNALDAAETAGVRPEISVRVVTGDKLTITVSDNGPGMSADLIKRVLDFDSTTSDKARYRSPTRGQQGNALKTVVGVPYALGSRDPLVIESRGLRHEITPEVVGGHVTIGHVTAEVDEVPGTSITATLPPGDLDPARWVAGAALENPYAFLRLSVVAQPADDLDTEQVDFYEPTAPAAWSKPIPDDYGSVHWYDLAAFTGLVLAQREKQDLLLSELARRFKGLSSTQKAAAFRRKLPRALRLSHLDHEDIHDLFEAMLDESTAPKATLKFLGAVGRDHFLSVIDSLAGVVRDGRGEPRCWYRGFTCDDDVPWLVEVFVAETKSPGQVFYAINHSPVDGDPLAATQLKASANDSSGCPKVDAQGVGGFLGSTYAHPGLTRNGHRAVVVHLVCPAPSFLTKGKSTLKVPPAVQETVGKALWFTTKELYREGRQRERAAAAADRAYEKRMKPARDSKLSLLDAVFAVLPDAIDKVSGPDRLPIPARNLFYAVREMIQKLPDAPQRELEYNYFSQNLLTMYQQQYGQIHRLCYDPSGTFFEPHTGEKVPLGTRDIDRLPHP